MKVEAQFVILKEGDFTDLPSTRFIGVEVGAAGSPVNLLKTLASWLRFDLLTATRI